MKKYVPFLALLVFLMSACGLQSQQDQMEPSRVAVFSFCTGVSKQDYQSAWKDLSFEMQSSMSSVQGLMSYLGSQHVMGCTLDTQPTSSNTATDQYIHTMWQSLHGTTGYTMEVSLEFGKWGITDWRSDNSPSMGVRSPVWIPAASMHIARQEYSATVLQSGKVLIAGGMENSNKGYATLSTAELYDPVTNTWSMTSSMHVARSSHEAILLQNGKVLVIAGNNSNNQVLASAELYDPATGTWSMTGSLHTPRWAQTATLLQNGTVLVTGGYQPPNGLSSAEIYDPATGMWALTNPMSMARAFHTAIILKNGDVLVVGGFNANTDQYSYSTEIYDPSSGTWTATGSLAVPQMGSLIGMQNGDVLLVGGQDDSNTVVATTQVYDPSSGTWTLTSNLQTARAGAALVSLPNGNVLAVGGCIQCARIAGQTSTYTDVTESYDPNTSIWSPQSSLQKVGVYPIVVLLQTGKVFLPNGFNDTPSPLEGELYG